MPRAYFFCDPTAWLSELVKYQPYVVSSIQKLETLIKGFQ